MSYSHRHLGRQVIVQALYWHEVRPKEDPEDILAYVFDLEPGAMLTDLTFVQDTFLGLLKIVVEIDNQIVKYAPEWPLEKISRIDLAILRLGIYELTKSEDIPPLVAINEAVELAKDFAGQKSAQFINGVLSTIAKEADLLNKK